MPFLQINNAVGELAPPVRTAIGGGAGDTVAALTDANNSTYVEQATAGTTTDWRITHFLGGAGLGGSVPANMEIQKIRFAMNCQTGVNQTVKCTVEIMLLDATTDANGGRIPTNFRAVQTMSLSLPGPSVYFVASDWFYYLQDISQPSAKGMPLPVSCEQLAYRVSADLSIPGASTYASFRIFDCNIQAYWTGVPTAAPTIAADTTNTVTWATAPTIQVVRTGVAYPMQSVQAKIFDLATVTDETFSPDDSPALWDSGPVLVNSNETAESVWLYPDAPTIPVGKLQVYARASRRAGVPSGDERWSQWAPYDPIPFGNCWGSPMPPKITLTDQMTASSRIKLDIAGQDNLLPNTGLSANYSGNGFTFVELNANTVLSFPVGLGKDSMASFRMFRLGRSGSSGATGVMTRGTGTLGIPVTAGRVYALAVWGWMNSGLTRNLSWDIDWYNSAGTFLSTTTTGTFALPASPTTTPLLCATTVTAPANSAYARYSVKVAGVLTTETAAMDGHTFRPYDNTDSNIPSCGGAATGNKVSIAQSMDGTIATTSTVYVEAINGSFDTAGTATAHTGSLADKFTRDTTTNRAAYFQVPNFSDRATQRSTDLYRTHPWGIGQFAKTTWSGSWWARANSTTRDMRLGIVWFDAMGTVLFIAWGATVSVTSAAYVKLTATGTGPAEAAYVGMRMVIDDGAASEIFFFDDPMLSAGSTNPERMIEQGATDQLNPDAFVSFVQVQRRINSGPWQDLDWMTTQYDYKQQITALNDYSAPYGSVIDYRARTVVPSGPNRVKYGQWSPTASVTTSSVAVGGRWKLKDMLDSTRNLDIDLISDKGFEWARQEDLAVFEPFGRTTPIIVADVVRSRTISCTVDIVNSSEWAAFLVLANSQRTLLLQRPWTGEQWWVRFTSKVEIVEQSTSPIRYIAEFELREVDVPALS